eukprot:1261876-Pleurochrysis_carterae.AAC.1
MYRSHTLLQHTTDNSTQVTAAEELSGCSALAGVGLALTRLLPPSRSVVPPPSVSSVARRAPVVARRRLGQGTRRLDQSQQAPPRNAPLQHTQGIEYGYPEYRITKRVERNARACIVAAVVDDRDPRNTNLVLVRASIELNTERQIQVG